MFFPTYLCTTVLNLVTYELRILHADEEGCCGRTTCSPYPHFRNKKSRQERRCCCRPVSDCEDDVKLSRSKMETRSVFTRFAGITTSGQARVNYGQFRLYHLDAKQGNTGKYQKNPSLTYRHFCSILQPIKENPVSVEVVFSRTK